MVGIKYRPGPIFECIQTTNWWLSFRATRWFPFVPYSSASFWFSFKLVLRTIRLLEWAYLRSLKRLSFRSCNSPVRHPPGGATLEYDRSVNWSLNRQRILGLWFWSSWWVSQLVKKTQLHYFWMAKLLWSTKAVKTVHYFEQSGTQLCHKKIFIPRTWAFSDPG